MLIELWRKLVATDYSGTYCGICGDDFELGSVYPVGYTDNGGELGEICPTCLEYLNRRLTDEEVPARGNWPSKQWPTVEDLEEARQRYPNALFETDEDLNRATGSKEADDLVYSRHIIWKMEPIKS